LCKFWFFNRSYLYLFFVSISTGPICILYVSISMGPICTPFSYLLSTHQICTRFRIYFNKSEIKTKKKVQIGPIEIDTQTGAIRACWNRYEKEVQIWSVEIKTKKKVQIQGSPHIVKTGRLDFSLLNVEFLPLIFYAVFW
jgi:hypothetical protein